MLDPMRDRLIELAEGVGSGLVLCFYVLTLPIWLVLFVAYSLTMERNHQWTQTDRKAASN